MSQSAMNQQYHQMNDHSSGADATILVVDECPQTRKFYEQLLGYCGHSVLSVPNGVSAMRVLSERPVNLVLTEILLPDIDGFEIIRFVSRQHPTVPILVVSSVNSAFPKHDYLAMSCKLGATRALIKPVEAKLLRATVRILLADFAQP